MNNSPFWHFPGEKLGEDEKCCVLPLAFSWPCCRLGRHLQTSPLTLQSPAALVLQSSDFRGLETTERSNACKTPSTAFRPCYEQVLVTASFPESLNYLLSVCVCVCIHMHVDMCSHGWMRVLMCVETREQPRILFLWSHHFGFCETKSPICLELSKWAKLVGQRAPGICLSLLL